MDRVASSKRIPFAAIAVGLAVAVGYVAWRWDLGLVWDDTSTACLVADAESGPVTLTAKVREAFSQVQGGGYRPLSNLLGRIGAEAVLRPGQRPVAAIVANGLLFGLLAALQFLTARRFAAGPRTAGYATFLFLASTPILTGGLVLFAGIQSLVPIAFASAVLLDDLRRDGAASRGVKRAAVAGLITIFLLAPWYREFTGLISVLLFTREAVEQRRFTPFCGLGLLAFAHALFPTALMSLAFPDLPLSPVYRLGSLGAIVQPLPDHISPGTVIRAIQGLHWRIFADLVSVLPPLALLVAAIGIVSGRALAPGFLRGTAPQWRAAPATEPGASALPLRTSDWFLWLWFALTFLPFLKAFKIQVHLAYSLLPMTILIARYTARAWTHVGQVSNLSVGSHGLKPHATEQRWPRLAIATAIVLAVADHALNPWIVHGTTRAITSAIDRRANAFQELPRGTPVLCNALQIQDIAYASERHIAIWSLRGGTPFATDAVPGVPDLRKRLERANPRCIVALDVRLPHATGQLGANRDHYVVEQRLVALDGLERVDGVAFRYPVVDPLKWLTPVLTTAWPGPPDLEFDFYRGPALDGTQFVREVAAEFWQARIVCREVADWQPDPAMIGEHAGCSLVLLGRRYYAIPVSDGAFQLDRYRQCGYRFQAEATTLPEVEAMADEWFRTGQRRF